VGGRLSVPGRGRGPTAGPFFVPSGPMSGFGWLPGRSPNRRVITRRRGSALLSSPPVLGGGFEADGRCGLSAAGFFSGLLRGRTRGVPPAGRLSPGGRVPTGRRGLLVGGGSRRAPGVLASRWPLDRGAVLGRVPRVAVVRFGWRCCGGGAASRPDLRLPVVPLTGLLGGAWRCFGGGAALRPGLRLPVVRLAGFLAGAWRCFGGGAALRPDLRLPAVRLAGFLGGAWRCFGGGAALRPDLRLPAVRLADLLGGAWRCLPPPAALPPRADTAGPGSGPSAGAPWTEAPAVATSSAARITPQRRMERPWFWIIGRLLGVPIARGRRPVRADRAQRTAPLPILSGDTPGAQYLPGFSLWCRAGPRFCLTDEPSAKDRASRPAGKEGEAGDAPARRRCSTTTPAGRAAGRRQADPSDGT
jgi:hypothetical protein